MSKSKFVLNKKGVRDLLRSAEMQSVVEQYASAMQARMGEGWESDVSLGKSRYHGAVWPNTAKAKKDNLKNNTGLKGMK